MRTDLPRRKEAGRSERAAAWPLVEPLQPATGTRGVVEPPEPWPLDDDASDSWLAQDAGTSSRLELYRYWAYCGREASASWRTGRGRRALPYLVVGDGPALGLEGMDRLGAGWLLVVPGRGRQGRNGEQGGKGTAAYQPR